VGQVLVLRHEARVCRLFVIRAEYSRRLWLFTEHSLDAFERCRTVPASAERAPEGVRLAVAGA